MIIDCVVSGIQLGWGRRCGLVCSTSSGFSLCCSLWEFFGLRFPLCVCARTAGRICCILEVVILLFSVVLDSGLCAQFFFCCVRCIMLSVSYC